MVLVKVIDVAMSWSMFRWRHSPLFSPPPEEETHSSEYCLYMFITELVLKARIANTGDSDYIEVELPRTSLTYEALLTTLCRELEVDKRLVQKVRKLPDTVLRKDKDVKRLCDLQELELVLTSRAVSQQSRNYGGPSPRHIDVVYWTPCSSKNSAHIFFIFWWNIIHMLYYLDQSISCSLLM